MPRWDKVLDLILICDVWESIFDTQAHLKYIFLMKVSLVTPFYLFVLDHQNLQAAPSTPGMRGRTVCWTLSSVWPIIFTPHPSTSHGQRMTCRSQRGYQTCVTTTTATGHSTEFQHWVSHLEREMFTPVRWSIKPHHSLSQRAGVRQAVLALYIILMHGSHIQYGRGFERSVHETHKNCAHLQKSLIFTVFQP